MVDSTLEDSLSERRRSLTRRRSGDVPERFKDNRMETHSDLGKHSNNLFSSSVTDIGSSSHNTSFTEQSFSESPHGNIPVEVVVINDDEENIPAIRGHVVKEDVEQKLRQFEILITSYRSKLQSSENLTNSLHKYLRQTQGYAENLLSERKELIDIIQEMEKDDNRRDDQELLLKFIMCSSLCIYLFGGSPKFLVAAVVLQLTVTLVNIIV